MNIFKVKGAAAFFICIVSIMFIKTLSTVDCTILIYLFTGKINIIILTYSHILGSDPDIALHMCLVFSWKNRLQNLKRDGMATVSDIADLLIAHLECPMTSGIGQVVLLTCHYTVI